jgi:hypothetical protein
MYIIERPTDLKKLSEEELLELPSGWHGWLNGVSNEMYLTFTLMTIGAGREPDTSHGKMLLVVMSFFVLVATSMYTANLATQLLLSAQTSSRYADLTDIVQHGESICVAAGTSTIGMVQEAYPAATLGGQI